MKNALSLPSDRSFGWTFAAVFALIGILHPWALAPAALFAAVTLVRAHWLAPLKRLWMTLGELLNHVVSPVVLGIMFFGVFTPVGWVMRLAGRDPMARSWEPEAESYWLKRDARRPVEEGLRDLF